MYVKADKLFNDEIKNYDMLVLPGGRPGGQNLLENQDVISLVQYFNEHHQYIAAMCSGTVVLEKANVIKGKKVTGYTGYQDKLVELLGGDDLAVKKRMVYFNAFDVKEDE